MNSQTMRLWAEFASNPNQEIPAPQLNKAAAGEGRSYVSAFSKRISDCRKIAGELGGRIECTKDERAVVDGAIRRETAYTYFPPQRIPLSDPAEKHSHYV